ncbi:hypothetical protein K7G98_02820 [Saccharothrix sp. MB29]|nr:hypothetical protein [Saccharothrix sp. MB29]
MLKIWLAVSVAQLGVGRAEVGDDAPEQGLHEELPEHLGDLLLRGDAATMA